MTCEFGAGTTARRQWYSRQLAPEYSHHDAFSFNDADKPLGAGFDHE
jgi:hypothetical protein